MLSARVILDTPIIFERTGDHANKTWVTVQQVLLHSSGEPMGIDCRVPQPPIIEHHVGNWPKRAATQFPKRSAYLNYLPFNA